MEKEGRAPDTPGALSELCCQEKPLFEWGSGRTQDSWQHV